MLCEVRGIFDIDHFWSGGRRIRIKPQSWICEIIIVVLSVIIESHHVGWENNV